jgi:hypothetical protein
MDVVLKLSFDTIDKDKDNSLDAEAFIYHKVTPELRKYTPNIVTHLGVGVCKQLFLQKLKAMSERNDANKANYNIIMNEINMLRERYSGKYNFDHANLLVTRKADGKTLDQWLTQDWTQWDEVEKEHFTFDVLIQIAYTLLVFEDLGFTHNDLHAGNVFVEALERPMVYSVRMNKNTVISRTVSFFVRIYDFDRSSKVATKYSEFRVENTLLKNIFCAEVGQCNKFRRNADWFTILTNYYHLTKGYIGIKHLLSEKARGWKARSKNGDNRGRLVHPGTPCFCTDSKCTGKSACRQIELDDTSLIKGPEAFMLEFLHNTKCKPYFTRPSLRV